MLSIIIIFFILIIVIVLGILSIIYIIKIVGTAQYNCRKDYVNTLSNKEINKKLCKSIYYDIEMKKKKYYKMKDKRAKNK